MEFSSGDKARVPNKKDSFKKSHLSLRLKLETVE